MSLERDIEKLTTDGKLRFFCVTNNPWTRETEYPTYVSGWKNNIKKCLKVKHSSDGYFTRRRIIRGLREIPLIIAKKATFFDKHMSQFLSSLDYEEKYMYLGCFYKNKKKNGIGI